MLEDFHGTAEAIVFPEAWAKLNQVILADAALLLTGGYSARDRGEDQAPFIVESARPLDELRASRRPGRRASAGGAPDAPPPDAVQAGGRALRRRTRARRRSILSGATATARRSGSASRRLRVAPEDDLVRALRDLLGADAVHYVKAG